MSQEERKILPPPRMACLVVPSESGRLTSLTPNHIELTTLTRKCQESPIKSTAPPHRANRGPENRTEGPIKSTPPPHGANRGPEKHKGGVVKSTALSHGANRGTEKGKGGVVKSTTPSHGASRGSTIQRDPLSSIFLFSKTTTTIVMKTKNKSCLEEKEEIDYFSSQQNHSKKRQRQKKSDEGIKDHPAKRANLQPPQSSPSLTPTTSPSPPAPSVRLGSSLLQPPLPPPSGSYFSSSSSSPLSSLTTQDPLSSWNILEEYLKEGVKEKYHEQISKFFKKLKGAYCEVLRDFCSATYSDLESTLDSENIVGLVRTRLLQLKSTPSPDYFEQGIPPWKFGPYSGASGSSVPSNHEPVDLKEEKFELMSGSVSVTESMAWREYQSINSPLQINTEMDTVLHISNILKDAIEASKLKLNLSSEVSMSNSRPDLLILKQSDELPVGAIEVKKPDSTSLTEHPKIFGELFDYLMLLKNTYNLQRVFGILTRYSDWYVCWLGGLSSSSSSSSSPLSPSSFLSPPQRYLNHIEPTTPTYSESQKSQNLQHTTENSPPPRSPSQRQSSGVFAHVGEAKVTVSTHSPTRSMFISKKFDHNDTNLWRMIITALTRMFETTMVDLFDPCYHFVAQVGGKIAGFRWFSLDNGVWLRNLNFTKLPHANTQKFYVWKSLGSGFSGRAFLASSLKHLEVCVLKCFFSEKKAWTKEEKTKSRETFRDHEYSCWKQVYKRYTCRKVTIFERPAILMQYFSFIRVEDRRSLLGAVRKTLTEDYDDKGYVHRDVKWRNIGQDSEKKAVVFDMDSVRKKEVGDGGWVDRAIADLATRCF